MKDKEPKPSPYSQFSNTDRQEAILLKAFASPGVIRGEGTHVMGIERTGQYIEIDLSADRGDRIVGSNNPVIAWELDGSPLPIQQELKKGVVSRITSFLKR